MSVRFVAALVVLSLSAFQAGAQELTPKLRNDPRRFESPQNFAFEFRLGRYRPSVDSEPGLTGEPYRDVFGDGASLYVGFEFDWQALRIPYFGTVGPGVAVGYMDNTTTAPFKVPRIDGSPSGSTTSLEIFPAQVLAVVRADALWRDWGIPVVPYFKGGLGLARWRSFSDGVTSSTAAGVPAKGSVYGYHLAAGAALNLNVFDKYTARNFDLRMGVNSTSVFFEVYTSSLESAFTGKPLYAGTTSWTAGLLFEF